MGYLALLYQDIIRSERVKANEKLPPVLPIVLYNGKHRWQAPVQLSQLIHAAPPGLEQYIPQSSYLLLDEGCFNNEDLGSLKNLVAALFRLENSRTDQDILNVVSNLIDWLKSPEKTSLRRAFTVWINRVLLPRKAPGTHFTEFNELQEVHTMLAETVENWTKDWEKRGLEKGIEQGSALGRQKEAIKVLLLLLDTKFGVITQDQHEKISSANTEQIETWIKYIFQAQSVEELLLTRTA